MPITSTPGVFRKGCKLGLVHRKVLDADAMLIAAHVDDTVHQQKWVRRRALRSVRQKLNA
jgi:hypothetical protein